MSTNGSEHVLEVAASPDEVRDRLDRGLVVVRHLWFTSPAELRAWDRGTSHLYVRWLRGGQAEIGPRLANLQAARLCPVVRVTLGEGDGGTRLVVSAPRLPTFAAVLLGTVAVLCAAWGGLIASAWSTGGPAARGFVFWLGLTAVIPTILAIAWGPGRRTLEEGLPELERVARDPSSGEDDW